MQQPQRFAPQSIPPGHMARFAQPAFTVLFVIIDKRIPHAGITEMTGTSQLFTRSTRHTGKSCDELTGHTSQLVTRSTLHIKNACEELTVLNFVTVTS